MSNPTIQVPDQASLQSFSASTNTVQQILEEAARLLKLLWRVSLPMKAAHSSAHGTQVLFCFILFEFCCLELLQCVKEDTPVKNMSSGKMVCKSNVGAQFLGSSHLKAMAECALPSCADHTAQLSCLFTRFLI